MTNCFFKRCSCALLLLTLLCFLAAKPVHADVYGRLHFFVHDSAGKPLAGANVIFHDSANVNPDFNVLTGLDGIALSPPLEIRSWQITTQLVTFGTDTRSVTVLADTSVEVDIPLFKKIINTGTSRVFLGHNLTTNATSRGLSFLRSSAATVGNPQSLRNFLVTSPGFVQDSVNQAHPRGEHSATSIYLNGFRLPGAFQGRAGQVLIPETIQNAEIQTGGYAPEYGGETAAVLNVNLRAGTIKPFQSFYTDGGSFNTYDGAVTFGGQAGAPLNAGSEAHQFGYLIDLNTRSTANSVEPPQPNNQSAHNHGVSRSLFGNFTFTPTANDQFSLALDDSPAKTEVANRIGLSSKYAAVGEGYGFAGIRNADGTVPGGDPTTLGGQTLALPSQNSDHQDIYQNDENSFGNLNYRHTFGSGLTGLFSYGATRSRLDIRNNNPAIDLNNLSADNSVEYNPTILKTASDSEFAGSLTQAQRSGEHTFKIGFLLDKQSGRERYQLVPGSQLALDSLAANDPDLVPANGTTQMDSSGNPIVDVLNYPVYTLPAGTTIPVVPVHRTGFYNAAYVQDTWRATRKLTVNYGVRFDDYKQDETLNSTTQTIHKSLVGPRLNMAYAFTRETTGRLAYNRLFIQPPLAQGSVVGAPIVPETLNQYDVSVEHQLASNQSVKLAYYAKDIRNQIDTNLLIPGTQIGAYSSVNFQIGSAHGTELSYTLTPHGGVGFGSYLAYANSVDKPEGSILSGGPVPVYNDHDALNTVSAGLNYSFANGALTAINIYHSSGTQSSKLTSLFFNGLVDNGNRQPYTTVNLSLASPRLAGYGGLELDVENVFNSLSPFNFNSGFSGTRFQQGRRVLLRLTGSF